MTYSTQNQNNKNQQFNQDKVFSKMLKAGGKNYFFDVKTASNGSNYLTITDSYKNKEGQNVTNRTMIFKDHIQGFMETLAEASMHLQ